MDANARPETPCSTDDKSSPVHGSQWDLLRRPVLGETGHVCHSPISPILARAWQYLDEVPGSGDSCESLESALTEDLGSSEEDEDRDETGGASERIPI